MAEWLKARQVESVVMESTGIYWIAPYEVLEGQGLQVLLENPKLSDQRITEKIGLADNVALEVRWSVVLSQSS